MTLREWGARLRGLVGRTRLDPSLDDEIRFHLDMLIDDYVRRGMNPAEARTAALRAFGGVAQTKEAYRDQGGLPFLETLTQDVRYGARTLLRTPGFTLAAVITLALGIGATTAIFSVVNAVLLRPLPYHEPDRIVDMYRSSGGLFDGHTNHRFQHFKANMTSFDAMAAWRRTAFNMVAGGQAEFVQALAVSEDYLRVMGGSPLYGRVFEAAEDQPDGPAAVVLRHSLWARLFASSPSAIGRTMLLGDRSYVIVGVMPEAFDAAREAAVYVPLQPANRGPGGGFNYRVTARLKPGVTPEQANAEAESVFAAYRASLPAARFGNETAPRFLAMQESLARGVKPALLLMLAAVGMLLLIACANTANLLLARASARGREIAVRAALGAARGRIVRQMLTESVMLFMLGGLLGVLLAFWAIPALRALAPDGYVPAQEVSVDGVVLAATFIVSLFTGILFGLAPALSLSRQHLMEAFKEDGTRTTSSRRSTWMRRTLVMGEIALCMLLLVGAGLLVQTFVRLRAVDLGFNPSNVAVARMSLMGERYMTSEAVNGLYERGLERLRQIPGVQSAAAVNGVPVDFGLNLNFDRVDTPEEEVHLTDWRYTTPDYFSTMGIQIVAGRGLSPLDDRGAPNVTVVSEQFARRYYTDRSAIGQRIVVFPKDGPIEIVGIARDLREAGLSGPVPAVMYVPVAQAGDAAVRTTHSYFQVSWIVKARPLTPEVTRRIREELRLIDPQQPITAFRSMDEIKARAMSGETFQMALLSVFAVIGALLAAAGIYGLTAYNVSQRTREFGIRLALGATRRSVLVLVLRQAVFLAAAGVATGAAAARMAGETLETFVFGVSTADVPTFAAVAGVLVAVALLASLVPAFRAIRLNPVAALRE